MKYEGIEIGVVTPFDQLFLHTVKVGWEELERMAPPRRTARSRSPAIWPQIKDDSGD